MLCEQRLVALPFAQPVDSGSPLHLRPLPNPRVNADTNSSPETGHSPFSVRTRASSAFSYSCGVGKRARFPTTPSPRSTSTDYSNVRDGYDTVALTPCSSNAFINERSSSAASFDMSASST